MKNLLKWISAFFIFFCLVYFSNIKSVNAQSPATGGSQISISPNTAQRQENRIADLKTRAQTEINRRVTALTNLITKINDMKRLTSDQKSSFTSQIQTEISTLNALNTKISADTDLTTLKTDVQSIITSYRVFALFMPQINIISAADRMLTIIDQINPLIAKLQTRIQDAQTKGNNVASLQTLLTDMQNKLNDAKTQANNAISAVTPLQPTGYPGNKTTLQSSRTLLKTAYQDLLTFRTDAKSIIQELMSFKTNGGSPTAVPSH